MKGKVLLAVVLLCSLVVSPFASLACDTPGQAGTTLSADVTARGIWQRYVYYDWSLEKSVVPNTLTLRQGEWADVDYLLDVSRFELETYDRAFARGNVCITNGGEQPTENLSVILIVQSKVGDGQFNTISWWYGDLSEHPVLAPGETYCYPYELMTSAPVEGTVYRFVAEVRITNHSGWLPGGNNCPGPDPCPFGPDPKADFSFPAEPEPYEVDAWASVSDQLTCPAGFMCETNQVWPAIVEASGSLGYVVRVTNVSALCDTYHYVTNTAVLTEGDSGRTVQDSESVEVYTGECPVSCTFTIGYWKTHAGFTGRNADRVTPLLPIWLGSLEVTNAGQAVQILSNMGSNGIDKLMAQLLATKLNLANGANGSKISEVVAAADNFLTTHNPADWESLSKKERQMVLRWMEALDAFNNSSHCG